MNAFMVPLIWMCRETDVSTGAGGDAAEQKTAPAVEEEPRELTLDEYKALKGNRQKPTYNLRKAGEGEDLTQWKKMYALKKKEGEEEEEEEEVCFDYHRILNWEVVL
jgi:plasminogen activator inhibitor 1 RNA-binding protein